MYLLAASSVETSSEGGGGNVVVGKEGTVGCEGEFPERHEAQRL